MISLERTRLQNYEIIKVEDPNILTDIDTQADYHLLKHVHTKGE